MAQRIAPAEADARDLLVRSFPDKQARIFKTAYTANNNFLTTPITPRDASALFRVHITMNASALFKMTRANGGSTITEKFNSGTSLVADSAYLFDVLSLEGYTINFQADAGTTILYFQCDEYGGI